MEDAKNNIPMNVYKDYNAFLKEVGSGTLDGVDITHDGYPLTTQESKFISLFVANGKIHKCLNDSGLTMRDIKGKQYIVDEIKYRLSALKDKSIADADEILRYFTKVMRGEEKDQFGLDAPLAERTKAAQELAKRIIDIDKVEETTPEIKVTLNWEGM